MTAERLGILWFVLDEESSTRLRGAVPPAYENEFYHHVTLQYGVGRAAVDALVGGQSTVEAYMVAHNHEAQACRVRTGDLPDMYGVPHVTLSTAKDIEPFASVAMVQGAHQETPLDPPIQLNGRLEFKYLDEIKD